MDAFLFVKDSKTTFVSSQQIQKTWILKCNFKKAASISKNPQ